MRKRDMNRVPEVSIVTPAYNAARFIGEAITSVRVQTFPDWEMLVADDGSRDDTRAIVERLTAQDPRVQLRVVRENSVQVEIIRLSFRC